MSDHAPAKKTPTKGGGGETQVQKMLEGVVEEAHLHDSLAKPFVEGLADFFIEGKGGGHH